MRHRGQSGLRDFTSCSGVSKLVPMAPITSPSTTIGSPALHFRETLRRNGSKATVIDRVLEGLARFLEKRGCSSLARSKFHAGEIGGMVHTLQARL